MAGEKILIWGAGAIGGTVGAYLKRAGHEVVFVDVVAEHVAAIRSSGLRITGPVAEFSVQAPAFLPAEVTEKFSRVFLCVKAHHTEEACRALLPHLADDGYVLSLQNGLCERIIADIAGPARTVGAFVNFGADWHGPGEIMYGNRGAVVLGEIDGRMTERLAALHRVMLEFDAAAITTNNIFGYLWGKLAYGSMLFAQALTNDSIADALGNPQNFDLWRRLGAEVMAVAKAENIQPMGFNGFDPAAFFPGASEAGARASIDKMVAFNRTSTKTHSGVWRDLAVRKRRTEVDVQIFPIAEIGASHGIATPLTRKLVQMIHEVEAGTRAQGAGNLVELAQMGQGVPA
jgi:2-dehydropantoate 2-reductase